MRYFLRTSTNKNSINSSPGHTESSPQIMEWSIRSSSGGSDDFERKPRRQITHPLRLSNDEEEEAVDDTGNILSQGSVKLKLCKVRSLFEHFIFVTQHNR